MGAAVDLRCAHLYQLDKAGLETAALDIVSSAATAFMASGAA
jgi:hypothetical protein